MLLSLSSKNSMRVFIVSNSFCKSISPFSQEIFSSLLESGNISINSNRLRNAVSSNAILLSAVFIVPIMQRLFGTLKALGYRAASLHGLLFHLSFARLQQGNKLSQNLRDISTIDFINDQDKGFLCIIFCGFNFGIFYIYALKSVQV